MLEAIEVARMAGGHHFMETPIGDAVVAYALPKRGEGHGRIQDGATRPNCGQASGTGIVAR